ncbi:Oxidoreductase htatip2 [Podochytrium sp. JEL0797]|nr:Oxidoreductase htatip2 [Podochytrium sp. JEL0797]
MTQPKPLKFEALVFGSTGAVGSQVVTQLLQNERCSNVIAITRRDLDAAAKQEKFNMDPSDVAANAKLSIRVVDFENLKKEDVESEGKAVNAVFCCLGTTRGDAGSAEAFRKGGEFTARLFLHIR